LIARNSKSRVLYRKFITNSSFGKLPCCAAATEHLSGQHMPHQHTRSAETPIAMSSGAATMDAITIFKITAASLLFIVAAVAGMLPLLVRRGKLTPRRQAAASTLTCAASGVLIASGLCHMLPESSEELVSSSHMHHLLLKISTINLH
jgi:ZIP Zinc transporter